MHILTRPDTPKDLKDPADLEARFQPDFGEIEAQSDSNHNVTVEIYADHVGAEDEYGRSGKPEKDSCMVIAVRKDPG